MTDEADPTASSAEASKPPADEGGSAPNPRQRPPMLPWASRYRPARLRLPGGRTTSSSWWCRSSRWRSILGSKAWAKGRLDDAARPFSDRRIQVIDDTFAFMFARNRGGAWGLLQDEPESIRRPFFIGISALAIAFIVSLYRKLTPQQWALKWGLPLVLGGALGNLVNRIQYNFVIDFIDVRAGWIRKLNSFISQNPTDHWPTFNVADIAIVAGVLLMAIDMFTPRKSPPLPLAGSVGAPLGEAPSSAPKAPVSTEAEDSAAPDAVEGAAAPIVTAPAPKET